METLRILLMIGMLPLMAGCGGLKVGGMRAGGLLQTPIDGFDLPEMAANLDEDQAMLVRVEYKSFQGDIDTTRNSDSTMTVGNAVQLMKAGAGMGGEASIEKVALAAVEKNREINTTVIIADSMDLAEMYISDNEYGLMPGVKIEDISVSVVATAGMEFAESDAPGEGEASPPSSGSPSVTPDPGAPVFPSEPTDPGDEGEVRSGSVKVDGVWVPAPDDPEFDELGEDAPGGWVERNQALWKAASDHGGNLVILLPIMQRPKEVIIFALNPSDHSSIKELARSRQVSRSGKNGNRAHIRFPAPGGAYARSGLATVIKVYMEDGRTLWYDVPSPGARHQMKVGRHQDAGKQWSE